MNIAAFYENIVTFCEQENMSLEEALIFLRDRGLEKIVITGSNLIACHEELMPILKRTGIGLEGIHEHFDFGSHPEDESWKRMAELTAECGGSTVLVVPGLIEPEDENRREEMIENMIAVTAKIADFCAPLGLTAVMEDFDDMRSPYNSVAGLDRFLERIPEMKVAYDTGNLCCYLEDELEGFEHFAGRTVLMHIKDRSIGNYHDEHNDYPCVCENGREEWVVPVGTGYIRIAEIVSRLKERGYRGSLIIELYGYKDMLGGFTTSLKNMKEMIG